MRFGLVEAKVVLYVPVSSPYKIHRHGVVVHVCALGLFHGERDAVGGSFKRF